MPDAGRMGLRGRPVPFLLCFLHGDIRRFGGGLVKYIHEEAAQAAARGIGVATVFPLHLKQFPRLREWASRGWGVCRDGRWEGMFGWQGLVRLLGRWERSGWRLAEIQLHHVGDFAKTDLRSFLEAVRAPVRLFLHDYHTVCRSAHLLREGTAHCGFSPPCAAKCGCCPNRDDGWLPGMKSLLGTLGDRLRVVAPSVTAARGWLETWPEMRERVEVVPHWVPVRTTTGPGRMAGKRLRLAFAGAQSAHKGWDVWCRLVAALREAGADYECLYFGLDGETPPGVRSVRVAEGGMTEALRRENADLLCLWPNWPETYSYVYHEALQAGSWILAPAVGGNIPDAIRKGGWGTVFADEGELRAFLLDGDRVRRTLQRALKIERPAEMAVNTRVLDTLPAPLVLDLPSGPVRRSRLHEAVYEIKEWTGHA